MSTEFTIYIPYECANLSLNYYSVEQGEFFWIRQSLRASGSALGARV